jgi:hypothetical protein
MTWNDFFTELFRKILPEFAFSILIGLLIIFLGIALGFLVKKAVQGILNALKFEKIAEQAKLNHAFGKISLTEVLADLAEIVVILTFIIHGVNFMGFALLGAALYSILIWVPKLLVGMILLAIFFIVAKYVETQVIASKMQKSQSVSKIIFGAIVTIGAVVSLRQMGVNTVFIEQALLIILFGFALAFALAVGISLGLGHKMNTQNIVGKSSKSKKKKKSR